ncbi:MAG: tripartite tricarboxylate transporter substrate binding protein [Xanthobacteraceae bacterium]|nr:tripartite tricarboxylate transporter substrate binding protein [Xanthobacteraceae bacterium]
MAIHRRRFLHVAAGAAALPAFPRTARANVYPTRPVHLIVTFPAGSAPDIIGRLAGQWLSERLGQQFIIENRPGAGGNIATEYVAKAEPDGYTLLMPVSTNAVNIALYRDLNYDFLRDIAPIAGIARTPFVLVVAEQFPTRTLQELIAYLKAHPGKVNMASGGIGSSPHLCGELLQVMTGTKMVHVAYRGNYMPDLLGGQVQVVFNPIAQAIPLLREGKLRALAVTPARRSAALPDVPSIGETLQGYDAFGWYGLGAPAKTPPPILRKLGEAMNAALAEPKSQERLVQLGVEPMPMTAADFGRHVADEAEKWGKVIKAQGITIN